MEKHIILKNNLLLKCIGLLVIISNSCSNQNSVSQMVFPGELWEERSPESLGVDALVMDSALSYFREHAGGVGTDEMIIIRNGYIIWKGPDIENRHELFSCTKVFTSTVMGVLTTQGKIIVDDLVADYFPGISQGNLGQEAYNKVRFRDLATMSAGYQGIVNNCWQLHLKGLHDESFECTQKYIIPGEPQYAPRTRISYRDPNVHMLGYILTKVAGKPLEDVFKEGVADRIGMKNWDWSDYGHKDDILFNNPAGTPNNLEAKEMNEIQAGIWTTAIEFARLGLLYLNKGEWDGVKILDSTFTEMAISSQVPAETPAIGVDLAGRYGFYWWTNGVRKDGTRPWPSAPPKTSTPHGGGRNFCFVIPEWNMVIVRTSPRYESPIPGGSDKIWEGFFQAFNRAVKNNQEG